MSLVNSFPGGNGGSEFDFENYQPTFTEVSTRANIASGEKNSVILGKLKKWYTDLKAVAFSGNASDLTPDSTHRFVTDTEKGTWNGKQNAITAGEYLAFDGNTLNAQLPVVANRFNKANIYSTTEKVVGCWIDGKPLYQKTIAGAFPSTINTAKEYSIGASVDICSGFEVFIVLNNEICIPLPNYTNDWSGIGKIQIRNNRFSSTGSKNAIVATTSASGWLGADFLCTVRYTKTTDAANSFKYADENDYSTTEHIVGSWIDGKPLYQKSFATGAITGGSDKTISTGITNGANARIVDGYIETGAGYDVPINIQQGTTTTNIFSRVHKSANSIIITSSISSTNGGYVTIQYTKTTD